MEVVPAVEDVADVGKTDVDEDAGVEDDGVEDGTAADVGEGGLMHSDGCCGNWLQLRCFGQGSLIMVKNLKQREKTSWQTERHGKRGGILRWLVQNGRWETQTKRRLSLEQLM